MNRTEIRLAGFGGQGVILAGMIIGRAASIYENLQATLIQSFGPEARGGACSAQVILGPETIYYPYVETPDVLVLMSQEAARIHSRSVREGGLIIYEQDLVDVDSLPEGPRRLGVPATRIAEELRRKMILNIVMVGFFTAVSETIGRESASLAVKASVPRGTESLNMRAFDRGFRHGLNALETEGF
jgi:2-oxoglutarate ferredoxin oxidoreductase subunit gamma